MKGGERTMTNERTFSKDKKQRGGISLRNLLNKKLKNEKGLTLIELLAVIVILAIIALIAIPAIGNIISNSKSKAILSDATAVVAGAKTAIADGACEAKEVTTGTGTNAKKTTDYTCNKAALTDYVEGVNLDAGDVVVKDKDGYKITYKDFSKLNDKYKTATGVTDGNKTVTQKKLAEAMGNKPEKTEETEKSADSPTN